MWICMWAAAARYCAFFLFLLVDPCFLFWHIRSLLLSLLLIALIFINFAWTVAVVCVRVCVVKVTTTSIGGTNFPLFMFSIHITKSNCPLTLTAHIHITAHRTHRQISTVGYGYSSLIVLCFFVHCLFRLIFHLKWQKRRKTSSWFDDG